ncbi:uncharacterized protein LTR77_003389 [Saxophila tyrrhenica]|uniref:ATPase AAA-type core domain-containing protein n=1 Tax=Saxophila tyrrhenica TaxID=1690608 RepID=A0AAV9PDM8_9PEZI|nr:hypothetical protein LTR77_003389 [Saxophila tyrrhenica]
MTAGTNATRPKPTPPSQNATHDRWLKHSSGQRVNTDAIIVEALHKEYPQLHLTVISVYNTNLLGYAAAGKIGLAPMDKEQDRLSQTTYIAPANRLSGGRGVLATQPKYSKYLLDWQGKEFVMYVVEGRDALDAFSETYTQFLLSPSVEATNQLLLEAGQWSNSLHEEVWVFDQGWWQKSPELYDSVRSASWDDVILDKKMKDSIIDDVNTFFDSQDTYQKLRVPWKRNGKTVSIKAMMHTLYNRKQPVPTLYVKTLASFAGPEYSIDQIFKRARREAPCYLIFEDLDSVVTDEVRSYFLNAVDGIQKNDGILMVGSTNHLDRLDPGIAKRPSRFDRKYLFNNPTEAERVLYMQYWQRKLSDNDEIEFPDKICDAVAKITGGFSFAYLQEAMVASLLALARESDSFADELCLECMEAHGKPASGGSCDRQGWRVFKGLYDFVWLVKQMDEKDEDLNSYVLWRELKKQIRILREGMEEEKGVRK